MDLKIMSLQSGSSGNCVLVTNGLTNILVDCGMSLKKCAQSLSEVDLTPDMIDAVLITHEHIDHIKGLGVLLRKHEVSAYGSNGTLNACIYGRNSIGKIDESLLNPIRPGDAFMVGDILVNSFPVTHDAAEPCAYTFSCNGHKIGMATDLGFYDDNVFKALLGSEALYIESNHDVNMLEAGTYPFQLKQRIRSEMGHLSNDECAELVVKLCNSSDIKINEIILGHLSEENNFPELAYETVNTELYLNVPEEKRPKVFVAPRFENSHIISIQI